MLDSKIPPVPLAQQWQTYQETSRLISPANKRQLEIIIIGTGLAGASAAATLAEQGYKVKAFCFQDSPRRAHSIAAQGGINAAKNYQNDGDSVQRLFYDTIKGGDYRSREANVYRLATISTKIIDHCVAQGVPFAREYGGLLSNRSFGGTQVQRTFYAAGQTGQQLLLGAYQALERQISLGNVTMYTRHEMLELVKIDGKARGIIARNLVTGELERHGGHAVLLCSGGYSNVFYLSTNAMGSNVSATWKAHKQGAAFANPCFTQIHPTCIPVAGEHQSKLTLMSESLRNDGRMWVPKNLDEQRAAADIPDSERDYFLERRYPAYGNLVPRDIASRAVKEVCDAGYGVGSSHRAVYLDFADTLHRDGRELLQNKYGNLFAMYTQITGEDPYTVPMRIYPAVHYTMGGLWVDYELMTTIPGLYCLGEANFSEHGANRLGASALMQGLADGYFVIPATISNYLAAEIGSIAPSRDRVEFSQAEELVRERLDRLIQIQGSQTVTSFHQRLGKIMWAHCGIIRTAAGLQTAIQQLQALQTEFWQDVKIPGKVNTLNPELDLAQRVADFLELGELMCVDALHRQESCGCHFRTEFQTAGEAQRRDDEYAHVAVWGYTQEHQWEFYPEALKFELARFSQRSFRLGIGYRGLGIG
ncbi:fumarate reductase/succinate dehydrogenase flavoprotein subunit [Chamaesiphon sp. OTE_8_metabat_110]|uniref:fumarate reductase/succinate dehydrogenase flavoprotein subunit n=1 Tax=Chamaesiphon sp. OTE_8_metabat_110 TaxID=2964696 RepID=UPI00286D34DD|nr:fumarate reductase/succinate dehydrogenase flavoprotein subunit [Chamaesiphon sp. OTE_8_metabat_110]